MNNSDCQSLITQLIEMADCLDVDGLRVLAASLPEDCASDFEVMWTVGWSFLRVNDLAAALSHLERATLLDPSRDSAWWGLGAALYLAYDYDAAERALRRALSIKEVPRTRELLAQVVTDRGIVAALKAAEHVLLEGLKLNPKSARLSRALAENLAQQEGNMASIAKGNAGERDVH